MDLQLKKEINIKEITLLTLKMKTPKEIILRLHTLF